MRKLESTESFDAPDDLQERPSYFERVGEVVTDLVGRFRRWKDTRFGSPESFAVREQTAQEQLGYNPQSLMAMELYDAMVARTADPWRMIDTDVPPQVRAAADELFQATCIIPGSGNMPLPPLMQELMSQDLKNQQVQELLKGLGNNPDTPSLDSIKESLDQGKAEELTSALQQGTPIPLDTLTPELKEQLDSYMDSLPKSEQERLKDQAHRSLDSFEDSLMEPPEPNEKMTRGSKRTRRDRRYPPPQERTIEQESEESWTVEEIDEDEGESFDVIHYESDDDSDVDYEDFAHLVKHRPTYDRRRRKVAPTIRSLTNQWRTIFRKKRESDWEVDYATGSYFDPEKRMEEMAEGIHALNTRSFGRRTDPDEYDYAFSFLLDMSGSVVGKKGKELLDAMIAILEPSQQVGLKTAVNGFSDRIYPYKQFHQKLSGDIRAALGGIPHESRRRNGGSTDLGWSLQETAGDLAKQREKVKTLVILSDGKDNPSLRHGHREHLVKNVLEEFSGRRSSIEIIPIIIGSEAEKWKKLNPNTIGISSVDDILTELPKVVRKVIS